MTFVILRLHFAAGRASAREVNWRVSQTYHARARNRSSIFVLLAILLTAFRLAPAQESAASQHPRTVVRRAAPVYPEIARRLHVTGAVKILATVAPNGSVKSVETLGGHPILAQAAEEAVTKWKYVAGPAETKELVELRFTSQ